MNKFKFTSIISKWEKEHAAIKQEKSNADERRASLREVSDSMEDDHFQDGEQEEEEEDDDDDDGIETTITADHELFDGLRVTLCRWWISPATVVTITPTFRRARDSVGRVLEASAEGGHRR